MSRAKHPTPTRPPNEVERKQTEELLADGKRMMRSAVRALIARIEKGEATAADLNASARYAVLLGLDRPDPAAPDADAELREALREWDATDDPSDFA